MRSLRWLPSGTVGAWRLALGASICWRFLVTSSRSCALSLCDMFQLLPGGEATEALRPGLRGRETGGPGR